MGSALHTGVLVVEGLLGLFMLYLAVLNFRRAPLLLKQWEHLRLPRWYTLLAGVLQTIGALALLAGLVVPVLGAVACMWMVAYFVVATATHVVRQDRLAALGMPLAFLALTVALVALRWTDLAPILSAAHLA